MAACEVSSSSLLAGCSFEPHGADAGADGPLGVPGSIVDGPRGRLHAARIRGGVLDAARADRARTPSSSAASTRSATGKPGITTTTDLDNLPDARAGRRASCTRCRSTETGRRTPIPGTSRPVPVRPRHRPARQLLARVRRRDPARRRDDDAAAVGRRRRGVSHRSRPTLLRRCSPRRSTTTTTLTVTAPAAGWYPIHGAFSEIARRRAPVARRRRRRTSTPFPSSRLRARHHTRSTASMMRRVLARSCRSACSTGSPRDPASTRARSITPPLTTRATTTSRRVLDPLRRGRCASIEAGGDYTFSVANGGG